jgi:hypothetical protein
VDRRFWIHHVLPVAFCLVPVLAAALVFVAIPSSARRDYWERIQVSGIDWIILAVGFTLFASQTFLAWRALRWQDTDFDIKADRWLTNLAQGAEWFPLLGLIGTVAAILQTFSSLPTNPTPQEIIQKYAPAITATGSGLFMALINILPTWVVTVGRDLIRSLAGIAPAEDAPAQRTTPPLNAPAPSANAVAGSPSRSGSPGQSGRGSKA